MVVRMPKRDYYDRLLQARELAYYWEAQSLFWELSHVGGEFHLAAFRASLAHRIKVLRKAERKIREIRRRIGVDDGS